MNAAAHDLWKRAVQALETAAAWAEADPDAAASRAYYAAFYAVSCLFAFGDRDFRRHSEVEAAVHRELVKSGKWTTELGASYSWLVIARSTGDYGGAQHVSQEDARRAVTEARSILQAVHSILPDSLVLPGS